MDVRTENLDLDLIDPDPGQPRKNKPNEYLRSLGESIKNKGLRNAIHVRENPDIPGRYLIINGECRWTASVLVGLKTIESKVFAYDGENAEAEVFLDQIMDNVVRKDMDPLETLQAYQTAINKGMSVYDLSQAFGKSEEIIEKDLPILGLPEILLKAFDKGDIPKAVCRKIAELPNHKKMLKAWRHASSGKNIQVMFKRIDAYIAKSSQGAIPDLFDAAIDDSSNTERKAAKVTAAKLMKAITTFQKTPFANGKGELMLVVNSRKLGELETMAKEMSKISSKIMGDIESYNARSKTA